MGGAQANLEAFLTEPALSGSTSTPPPWPIAGRRADPDHLALAGLPQRAGAVSALITQAVDRLHARAGSTDVVEVYGTLMALRCEHCW